MSGEVVRRDLALEPIDNERLANLAGPFDAHLRQIERRLGVELASRGNLFRITGPDYAVRLAERALGELWAATAEETLDGQRVNLMLAESGLEAAVDREAEKVQAVTIKVKGGAIRARGPNQARYLHAIQVHDVNFGIGPAGTGKTYLAVAMAVDALNASRVQRIVLTRPAVEAGERLGFLPGDALYEMVGFEKVAKLIERNVIEIAPLAFMRGRTLNDAFVILDEAQNTTIEQMKMFLTRIGFGSCCVVTGDLTQIDLPRHQTSGLRHAIEVLRGVHGMSFTFFTARDVVRHPLVARIVEAYEAHEARGEPPAP
jgi:phosphate starvation-inducible PhoH-like protein